MFSLTGRTMLLALLVPAYLLFVVLWVIVLAVAGAGFGHDLPSAFVWWPLPCIFPAAALVVLAQSLHGAATGRLDPELLTGAVFVGWLLTFGSALALSSHHAHSQIPVLVSGGSTVVLLVTRIVAGVAHRRAAPAVREARQ